MFCIMFCVAFCVTFYVMFCVTHVLHYILRYVLRYILHYVLCYILRYTCFALRFALRSPLHFPLQVVHWNSPDKHHVYYGTADKDSIADYFKNFYMMFVQYDGNLLKHKYMSRGCPKSEANGSTTTVKPTIVRTTVKPTIKIVCTNESTI